MTEPVTLACPECGSRLELTPAQREDRQFSACCQGENRTHRIAVMRVVDDVVEAEA